MLKFPTMTRLKAGSNRTIVGLKRIYLNKLSSQEFLSQQSHHCGIET